MQRKLFIAFIVVTFIALTARFSSAEPQQIHVGFSVPASNYKVKIQKVYQVGDEVWVVSKVTSDGFGLQVISTAGDDITLDEKVDGKVIHKVLGKSWNWGKDTDTVHYVEDAKAFKDELEKRDAKVIWQRKEPKAE